jgi:DNA segregation ATPase FtsK/SpoIIIE-like protein
VIQRKYALTYHRACEIIGWMEEMEFISQHDGSSARKVLITEEEFNNKYEVL